MYRTEYTAKSGNEKTNELKALYKKVAEKTPEIKVCEKKKPFADDDRIYAIFFNGEDCCGRTSDVFAYIGFPENASSENPVPGMVLVHGGAGHAYAEWVRYWVDNGYAAISFDGFAQQPDDGYYTGELNQWSHNPKSHPPIDDMLSDSDKKFTEQWFYHYVADTVLANSIMRADSRVITDKIGVTGISWGSMATSVAICYDNRFSFAIPVYGSGFLDKCTAAIGTVTNNGIYADVWDSSHLLSEVDMPVLYVNSDCDPFFSANCTTASAAYTKNGNLIYAQNFIHCQEAGAYQPEILRFANEQNSIGEGNIKITGISLDINGADVSFDIPKDVKNIESYVYFRIGELEYDGLNIKEKWLEKNGTVTGNTAKIKVPEEAEYFYFSIQGSTYNALKQQTVQATTGIYSKKMLNNNSF